MGIYWCMKTNSPNLRIFSKSIWYLRIKISCFCLHLRHKRWIPGYLAICGVGGGGLYLPNPQTKGSLTVPESSEHSRPLWPRQLSGFPRNAGILSHLRSPPPTPDLTLFFSYTKLKPHQLEWRSKLTNCYVVRQLWGFSPSPGSC